ncbi:MAG: extracellular solute-binding protein [Chloroflexi bacterium]|nr:extracellular solute-binding protein [Chloroflexota bacterium]
MLQKTWLVLTLSALVLLTAVGAISAQDLSGVDPSGVTITYWHQYSGGPTQEIMGQLVEEFNATNEWGITVEANFQGNYGEIEQAMSGAILNRELPNLVAAYANAAANWNNEGVVVNINQYYDDATWGFSEDDAASLNQGILNVGIAAGTRVVWPNQISAQLLFFNLTMAEELGFAGAPSTLAEFREIACAAAAHTGPNGEDIQGFPFAGGSSEMESFIIAHGGDIYDHETGLYTFNTPEVVAALSFVKALYEDGCGYFYDQRYQNTGDFALYLNPMALSSTAGAPFVINDIRTSVENGGVDLDWVITTMPPVEAGGERAAQVFVPSISILVSTPEEQLASWLFLKFLAQAESQVIWASNTGYFPTQTGLSDSLTIDTFRNEALFPFFQQANAILSDSAVRIYSGPPVASFSPVRGLLGEAYSDVTLNGRDPAEVAEELELAANELVDELDN